MDDSSRGSSVSASQSQMGVPVAIVIAGALIAGALYFGGGRAAPAAAPVAGDGGVAGAAADEAPAEPETVVGDIREVTDADHVKGAANAKVTIIEYSDLECPFCKRFHPVLQQVLDENPNDVRWVYRHFPLTQLHAQAHAEAVAVECAGEQDRFWELLDLIFEVTPGNDGLDLDALPELAGEAGVPNIAQFSACLESDKFDEKIAADIEDATTAGGRGTPYSVILGPDGEKIPVSGALPFESVKASVEGLL